jgi:hypothetical protein
LSSDRVDKQWQSKGLDMYSTESILGTLHHYGVKLTFDDLKEQVEKLFPVTLGSIWSDDWRGTGQFLNFHFAAAEELWRRLMPEALAPLQFGVPLIKLLEELEAQVAAAEQKKPLLSHTLETRFQVCESLLVKIPTEEKRREDFLDEMQMAVGEDWVDVMNSTVENLAAFDLPLLCQRYLALETALFPSRKGISEALAILAKDKENSEALAQLKTIAESSDAVFGSRIDAASVLVEFKKFAEAKGPLLSLMDVAVAAKDTEMARAVLEELRGLMPDHLSRVDLEKLKSILNQLLADEDLDLN